VSYDDASTSPERLAQVIAGVCDKFSVSRLPAATTPTAAGRQIEAPLPDEAPDFLVEAFEQARAANRPMVLDFQTEWCGACQRLKKETLQHPSVADLLAQVQMVYVDLDKNPKLGDWYGISAVPDVVFVDRNGIIADRLNEFEPPEGFASRVRKLLSQ